MRIDDAYEDPRFNPQVDMVSNYRTRSVLCVPVFATQDAARVTGVVMLLNKKKKGATTSRRPSALATALEAATRQSKKKMSVLIPTS